MSIADYFAKSPERERPMEFDASVARRQFRQALWLIGVVLAAVVFALMIRMPSDADLRPRGKHAIGADQAERNAGHGPAGRFLPGASGRPTPAPAQGFANTRLAQSGSAGR